MDGTSTVVELLNRMLSFSDNVPVIRAVTGIILVFFGPGFAWTLILFEKLNRLERFVLSFPLSLALVTLTILAMNVVIDMRITGFNALLSILLLTIIPLIIFFLRKYRLKRRKQSSEE